jgi:hypothetical protein
MTTPQKQKDAVITELKEFFLNKTYVDDTSEKSEEEEIFEDIPNEEYEPIEYNWCVYLTASIIISSIFVSIIYLI